MPTEFTKRESILSHIRPAQWDGCREEECRGCARPTERSDTMVVYSTLRKDIIRYTTLWCDSCGSSEQREDGKQHGILILTPEVSGTVSDHNGILEICNQCMIKLYLKYKIVSCNVCIP